MALSSGGKSLPMRRGSSRAKAQAPLVSAIKPPRILCSAMPWVDCTAVRCVWVCTRAGVYLWAGARGWARARLGRGAWLGRWAEACVTKFVKNKVCYKLGRGRGSHRSCKV